MFAAALCNVILRGFNNVHLYIGHARELVAALALRFRTG